MKIDTTRFGKIDILDESILHIQGGMFGFEKNQRFAIVEEEADSSLKWLQSMDDPALAFVVINPLDFFPDYDVELSEEEAESLGLKNASGAAVITTVTVDKKSGEATTNLLGPIVINSCTLLAKQVVAQNEKYGTKHLIAREIYQEKPLESAVAA
jgi:flagellar assembly factor FliW